MVLVPVYSLPRGLVMASTATSSVSSSQHVASMSHRIISGKCFVAFPLTRATSTSHHVTFSSLSTTYQRFWVWYVTPAVTLFIYLSIMSVIASLDFLWPTVISIISAFRSHCRPLVGLCQNSGSFWFLLTARKEPARQNSSLISLLTLHVTFVIIWRSYCVTITTYVLDVVCPFVITT